MKITPGADWIYPAQPVGVSVARVAVPWSGRFPLRRFGALSWRVALWLSGTMLAAHLLGLG
jgi:hypothetical protein